VHVIEAAPGNRTEQKIAPALADVPGLLITNFRVVVDRQTRELDALAITPHGVTLIEAKGTGARGQVEFGLNTPWTVDGRPGVFKGGKSPDLQARNGAQVLAAALKAAGLSRAPFIEWAVALDGDIWFAGPPRELGDGAVAMVADLPQVVDPALTLKLDHDVTLATVHLVLKALRLEVDDAVLRAQGFVTADEASARRAADRRRREATQRRQQARLTDVEAALQSRDCPCGARIERLSGAEAVTHYEQHTRQLRDERRDLTARLGARNLLQQPAQLPTAWDLRLPPDHPASPARPATTGAARANGEGGLMRRLLCSVTSSGR
jgi:hypothetical protein